MKMTFVHLSVLASVAFCSVAVAADLEAAKRGETLYMQHQCYSCHGTQGQGYTVWRDKLLEFLTKVRAVQTQ